MNESVAAKKRKKNEYFIRLLREDERVLVVREEARHARALRHVRDARLQAVVVLPGPKLKGEMTARDRTIRTFHIRVRSKILSKFRTFC